MKGNLIMKITAYLFLLLFAFSCKPEENRKNSSRHYDRWSVTEINEWYNKQGWLVGCNYIPSNKVNQIDMWQAESYDPVIIDKELAMAEDLGFNVVRIFLHDLVYKQDSEGFKDRFADFLRIADSHGMRVIPNFFTNGGKEERRQLGKQPDEIPGTHNIHWARTPGQAIAHDPSQYGPVKKYVQDFISTFADDERILCWYLYNEPWNNSIYQKKDVPNKVNPYNLLVSVFEWARECGPTQPLTSCMYVDCCPTDAFLGENADIITFHCYKGPEILKDWIYKLEFFNRPIMCGEYMGRPVSTFKEIMPILKEHNIIAVNFGLTAGKPGFYNQWNSPPSDIMPAIWFHDILTADGIPYDDEEVKFIKSMTADKTMNNLN